MVIYRVGGEEDEERRTGEGGKEGRIGTSEIECNQPGVCLRSDGWNSIKVFALSA